jgi:hypothetical protein
VLFAACTSNGGPGDTAGGSPAPTYRPTGKIVVLAGRFASQLSVLDAAKRTERQIRLPRFGGAFDNAFPAPDGRFYVIPLLFSSFRNNQMYLLGEQRPEPVGPPVQGVQAYQIAGGYALTWGCPGPMRLLDLAHPTEWKELPGNGCAGSISPDHKRLAYATPTALYVMDLPDGEPKEVLRFRDLPELRPAHVPARSLDAVLWGDQGIAVQVGDASRSAMVVWREDEPPVVTPMGNARLGPMRWQPGGGLLAFYDYAPNGEVRTLDPATGETRQIAISDYGRLAWSPDGKALVTARSQNVMALVDPRNGRQLGTLTASGVPIAWLPT